MVRSCVHAHVGRGALRDGHVGRHLEFTPPVVQHLQLGNHFSEVDHDQ